MKSLLLAISALMALSAQANEENIELYHQEQPVATNAQRPAVPKLGTPEPLASVAAGDATLTWKAVAEASAYALQVSEDPIFFKLLVNEPIYKETSYSLKDIKLESGKTYYWRVASLKQENQPGSMKSLFNRSSFIVK
jgi:hypothetical protein